MIEDSQKEIEKLQKELDVVKKEFTEFVYITSHDLKAHLRAVFNLSSWIQDDLEGNTNQEIKENLKLLQERASKMQKIIDALLEYSRISRFNLDKVPIKIIEVINEAIDDILPPDKNNIEIKINGNLPIFTSYKEKLLTVFRNLLDNAVKFNDKEKKVININISDKNDYFEFSITDNGSGISDYGKEKIFNIFYKSVPKEDNESMGVGLTIAKKIVNFAGGELWVNSNLEGNTEFIFTWPIINKE